ncbi:MAG: cAMP-activated global transcriptional regulator CRP [Syntrophorhabdus sp. PtaU1.Bin058]|nr:MAG: cAMP-activated global transcriptional regulator CRP [Syntrophorhabdus sp. PtaU1.Bin058]
MYDKFIRAMSHSLLIVRGSIKSFQKNNNLDEAASLAYYGFFAFIPLFFIAISIFSVEVTSSKTLVVGVEKMAGRIIPQFGKVLLDEAYFLTRHRGTIGIFGFLMLFWTITPLVDAIRRAFSGIFRIEKRETFLRSMVVDALAASVIVLLFAAILISELFFDAMAETTLKGDTVALAVIDYVAPPIVTFVSMLFFYTIFSPVRLSTVHLVIASFFSAVFWTLIKEIFSRFLFMNPNYGFAFGSFKVIFIIILWSYFSFLVMLFGAELLANMRNRDLLLLKNIFLDDPASRKLKRGLREKFARTYESDEEVFRQGDPADSMFYVVKGSVGITRDQDTIGIVREGEYFGELSMFLSEPRADTAIAIDPGTEVVIISKDNFHAIVRENPNIIFSILRNMAASLKIGG